VKRLGVAGAIFVLITILVVTFPSLAVIQVSGLVIEVQISAGESYTGSFHVINRGEQAEDVKVYLADWNRDSEGGKRFFKAGMVSQSLAKWIDYFPSEFRLEANKTEEVKFTISVPAGATGTHWSMFFVEGEPILIGSGEIEEKRTAVVTAVIGYGIQIYQIDPNTAVRRGRIIGLDVIPPNPDDNRLGIKVTFENTGNTHLRPRGRVEVRDRIGETVDQIDIEGFPILPGDKRILNLTYEGAKLSPDKYLALVIIDFWADYLVAGQRVFEMK